MYTNRYRRAYSLPRRPDLAPGEAKLTEFDDGTVLVEFGRQADSGSTYTKRFQLHPDEQEWLMNELTTLRTKDAKFLAAHSVPAAA